MKQLKIIGVLMVALFALAGVASASASAAEFHSEVTETSIFGQQEGENIFHTTSGNVKCKKAAFTQNNIMGTGTAPNFHIAKVQVSPEYSECTAFGQAAFVDMNGATYTITPTSASTGSVVIDQGTAPIEVTVPTANCDVTIAGQTPTGNVVDLANSGTGASEFVKVTATVTGIAYTVVSTTEPKKGEGESTTCGTVGAHPDAEYTGVVNEKGFTSSAHTTQVGIKVE
jgi:hypothetical protein